MTDPTVDAFARAAVLPARATPCCMNCGRPDASPRRTYVASQNTAAKKDKLTSARRALQGTQRTSADS